MASSAHSVSVSHASNQPRTSSVATSTDSGLATFHDSKLLAGGNGTAWSSSSTGCKRCTIDEAGSPGHLTAS